MLCYIIAVRAATKLATIVALQLLYQNATQQHFLSTAIWKSAF